MLERFKGITFHQVNDMLYDIGFWDTKRKLPKKDRAAKRRIYMEEKKRKASGKAEVNKRIKKDAKI